MVSRARTLQPVCPKPHLLQWVSSLRLEQNGHLIHIVRGKGSMHATDQAHTGNGRRADVLPTGIHKCLSVFRRAQPVGLPGEMKDAVEPRGIPVNVGRVPVSYPTRVRS